MQLGKPPRLHCPGGCGPSVLKARLRVARRQPRDARPDRGRPPRDARTPEGPRRARTTLPTNGRREAEPTSGRSDAGERALRLPGSSRYVVVTVVSRALAEGLSPRWTPATRSSPRWLAAAVLAGPGAALGLVDWASRHEQIATWSRPTLALYAGTLALSTTIWAAFVVAASSRRAWAARALLVVFAALALGAQRYFFERYHAYMNPRAVLVGTSMLPSVGQQLWIDRASFLRALAPPVALALLLTWLLGRAARVPEVWSRAATDVAAFVLIGAAFSFGAPGRGEQACAPDVLYLASMGRLAKARWQHDDAVERAHPGQRTPLPVPPIAPRGELRSVLLVLTESVRATDACSV